MKIALPTKKDCKYIRKKLRIFYEANRIYQEYPTYQHIEFHRAMLRMFTFFQLPTPKIEWIKSFGLMFGQPETKILGQCTTDGIIKLLTPYFHNTNFEGWLDTVYHEIGHYVLWVDTEKNAKEFASKIRLRG